VGGLLDILLVEDDEADAWSVCRVLSAIPRAGNVEVAKTGDEALVWLREPSARNPRVHVILLDVHLPGKTGIEIIRELKSDPTLAVIPVILLSDSRNPDQVFDAYAEGAAAFLTKPANPDGYRRVLGSLVEFWLNAALPSKT
jgi:two-component system, chemotaxis family, response regulator Rcp1